MSAIKNGSIEALKMLRTLPRVNLGNIRNTGAPKKVVIYFAIFYNRKLIDQVLHVHFCI